MPSSSYSPLDASPPEYEEPEGSNAASVSKAILKGRHEPDEDIEAAAPPDFSDHRANISLNAFGDVVSHDEHLNEDPEALFQFIRLHTKSAPELWISVKGEHDEQHTEHFADHKGKMQTRQVTRTVVDFSFEVPVRTYPDLRGRLYVVPPELPAWRGRGFLRRGGIQEGGIALPADLEAGHDRVMQMRGSKMKLRARRKADGLWRAFRKRGLPLFLPWSALQHHVEHRTLYFDQEGFQHPMQQAELDELGEEVDPLIFDGRLVDREAVRRPRLASTAVENDASDEAAVLSAVREWCQAYCWETRPLKQFELSKSFHGWHFARVEAAVRSIVRRAPYNGRIHIAWRQTSSSVRVLPSTRLSRLMTVSWPLEILMWLTLIYPVLLLLRAFFLGAHFDTVRATYALTRWLPMRDVLPNATEEEVREQARARGHFGNMAKLRNANGDYEWWLLEGETEDTWLCEWRDAIHAAIARGATGPLRQPSPARM